MSMSSNNSDKMLRKRDLMTDQLESVNGNSLIWSVKPFSKRRIDYTTPEGSHLHRKEDTLDPGSTAMSIQCELRKKIRRKYGGKATSDWETWKDLPETEFRHQLIENALIEEENQRENFSMNCFNGSFK